MGRGRVVAPPATGGRARLKSRAGGGRPFPVTYVLPLRWADDGPVDELASYLRDVAEWVEEVIVVDGSSPARFDVHHRHWGTLVTHLPPDPDLRFLNGKVNGVLTGLRRAHRAVIVVADDDVRYDPVSLRQVVAGLASADVVRPQNYFAPLPWHARWDTARILVARATGGDFPGTLAVRRPVMDRTGGYDGDVLFENLELMRTVEAAGGVVRSCPGCYVRRLPPTARHFWSQRVRQAYDELARPGRMALSLTVLPLLLTLAGRRRYGALASLGAVSIGVAEVGRRRAGGCRVFPVTSSLLAVVWVVERAACSWIAVLLRARGGCPYAGARLRRSATPVRRLRRRFAGHLLAASPAPNGGVLQGEGQ